MNNSILRSIFWISIFTISISYIIWGDNTIKAYSLIDGNILENSIIIDTTERSITKECMINTNDGVIKLTICINKEIPYEQEEKLYLWAINSKGEHYLNSHLILWFVKKQLINKTLKIKGNLLITV